MRDIHYKGRNIRMSDETWEDLKKKRQKSKLSWNLFIVNLLKKK